MRPFQNREMCALVTGGPAAKYREVGINVCVPCVQDPEYDEQEFLSVYLSRGPLPLDDPERMKPRFMSDRPLEGFLKLSLLDNGLWRVGFHRGHAEVWSGHQVEEFGQHAADFRYSSDYSLYGPAEVITGTDTHRVIRVEFLDMRAYAERRMPEKRSL